MNSLLTSRYFIYSSFDSISSLLRFRKEEFLEDYSERRIRSKVGAQGRRERKTSAIAIRQSWLRAHFSQRETFFEKEARYNTIVE